MRLRASLNMTCAFGKPASPPTRVRRPALLVLAYESTRSFRIRWN